MLCLYSQRFRRKNYKMGKKEVFFGSKNFDIAEFKMRAQLMMKEKSVTQITRAEIIFELKK